MNQDQAIAIVQDYTEEFNEVHVSNGSLNKAVQVLASNPDNVYEGPMYRTVYLSYDVISKFETVDELNQYLIDNAQEVSSWCKSIIGMFKVIVDLIDDDWIVESGGVVISRTGKALDCESQDVLLCDGRVQDFTVHGFSVGCDQLLYSVDQYDRFLSDLHQLEVDEEERQYILYIKNLYS